MTLEEAVLRVQFAYPRIYLACHTRHQNQRTTPHRLSPRDASILAHLDPHEGVRQSELTKHLGLAKSTVSEAVAWLVECGYVERVSPTTLRLTAQGVDAVNGSSVLEAARLQRLLRNIPAVKRESAVEGLEILAHAARRLK